MMQILCQDCQPNKYIAEAHWREHQVLFHEYRVEEHALVSLIKVTDRVRFILEKYSQARSSDAVLREKYYQLFPSSDGIRLLWNVTTKRIEWNRNPTFEEYLNIANPDTISRAGRAIRKKHPELQGSRKMELAREIKERTYRQYYAGEAWST